MTEILTYSATFFLGLIHAFEPGHGKSILAAFSIRKASFKIFSSLIFSLFVSHFFVLGLFAVGLQALSSTEFLEDSSRHLQLVTPVVLIAFGGYLFFGARRHHITKDGCSCGHNHISDEISDTKTASITGLIAGLMPCPTAVAPLIISGVHQSFSYTLVHILVYVTGMTLALFVFTALLLVMKSIFQRKLKLMESRLNFNFLSALVMIGIGVVYLVINLSSTGAHQHF